jgi:hypothetical protein
LSNNAHIAGLSVNDTNSEIVMTNGVINVGGRTVTWDKIALWDAAGSGTGTSTNSTHLGGVAAADYALDSEVTTAIGVHDTNASAHAALFALKQDAATAEADGAQTIAAADFVNGIVVHTVTGASALSTPTGAQIAAVLPAGVTTGDAFRLHVITVGAGADDISTLTAGDGDVTFVGNVTVGPDDGTTATNGFGSWIFRMTGATSFVGYRVG